MKYLIFILIYIFCFNAFSCPEISGKWNCTSAEVRTNGEKKNIVTEVLSSMELVLSKVDDRMTFHIETDGDPDGDNYILDEGVHTDKQNLNYTGKCDGNVVTISGHFPEATQRTKSEYLTHFISYLVDEHGPYIAWTVDSNVLRQGPRVVKLDCRQQLVP